LTLKEEAASALRKLVAFLVLILLFSYLISMVLGPLLFYTSPQGLDAASNLITELPLSLLMIANFSIPMGTYVGIFFLAIWLLYVAAFALAWVDAPSFPVSIKNAAQRANLTSSNYLVVLPQLSTILLVAIVLLQSLQESAGVQTGSISFDNPVLGFLSVSYAPFVEELSYRITTLGLLDGLYLVWRTRRRDQYQGIKGTVHLLASTMWKPDGPKKLLGFKTIQDNGLKGISWIEWLILIATSGAFGAAHYLYGGGWEIGKISTAMISGLALGYVYLRYGAYAPILLHWYFNYYFGAFDLASQLKMPSADLLAAGTEFMNFGGGILLASALILTSLGRLWSATRRRA
jgi:hypothetical protein